MRPAFEGLDDFSIRKKVGIQILVKENSNMSCWVRDHTLAGFFVSFSGKGKNGSL